MVNNLVSGLVKINDVTRAKELDLISGVKSNPVIVSGVIDVTYKDEDLTNVVEEEEAFRYNWSASFMGTDVSDKNSWSISGNFSAEDEEIIIQKIFDKIKEAYLNPTNEVERRLRAALNEITSRLSKGISFFEDKFFDYLFEKFNYLINIYLTSVGDFELQKNTFMEVLYQSLEYVKRLIEDMATQKGVVLSNMDEVISFIESNEDVKNYVRNYLKNALTSSYISKFKSLGGEETLEDEEEETKKKHYRKEIPFSDLASYFSKGEEEEEDLTTVEDILSEKAMKEGFIDELTLEKSIEGEKEFNQKVNKIKEMLKKENAMNALKLFEKIMDILENGFNEADLQLLESKGIELNLASNKLWSTLLNMNESSVSEAFKKLRFVFTGVFPLSFKRTTEIDVIEEFVNSRDVVNVKEEIKNLLPEQVDFFKTILKSLVNDIEYDVLIDFFFNNKPISSILDHYDIGTTELANAIQKGMLFYKKYIPLYRSLNIYLNKGDVKDEIRYMKTELSNSEIFDIFLSKLNSLLSQEEWDIFNEYIFDKKNLVELVEEKYDLNSLKKALEVAVNLLKSLKK